MESVEGKGEKKIRMTSERN